MIQIEFSLKARKKGIYLITEEIIAHLPLLPETGLLHLFLKHTSAALTVNENADSGVRRDLEGVWDRLIREREPYYTHTQEGDDDMPAHAKTVLTGVELTLPISNGRLNLGMWQGIYLCEFRRHGGSRNIVATILS